MDGNFVQKFYYQGNIFQQLKGFCATVETGSLSKAAIQLHTSHSAISLQIKSLEQDLNIQLLHRKGPRIEITEQGRLLYKLAMPHLNGLNNLKQQFNSDHSHPSTLRIGVNQSVVQYLLPSILPRFYEENPSTSVTVVFGEQTHLIEKLLEADMDVAIVPRRLHDPFPIQLTFIQAISFPVSLITRRDHPLAGKKNITLTDIAQYELILPPKPLLVIPNLYEMFEDLNLTCKLRTRFENSETTRKFVEMGFGINVSSEIVLEPDHPTLCATPLSHLFPPVDYGVLLRRNNEPNHTTALFIDCVRKFDIKKDFRFG